MCVRAFDRPPDSVAKNYQREDEANNVCVHTIHRHIKNIYIYIYYIYIIACMRRSRWPINYTHGIEN